MEKAIMKELVLDGLDCAHCASKIESMVNEINGVETANLNFLTKTLSIEVIDDKKIGSILSEAKDIIKNLEPDVTVQEKSSKNMNRKVLILEGLDCANCAGKIEFAVRRLSGVTSANLDFVSKRLRVEAPASHLSELETEIRAIIKELEPGVTVYQEKDRSKKNNKVEVHESRFPMIQLITGAIIYFAAVFLNLKPQAELILFVSSYFLIGGGVILRAVRNILRGEVFDENFLMLVATIGAFSIRQYSEAVGVMLFYQVGETFQGMAVNRSRRSIQSLMNIRPDFANLKIGENVTQVDPEEVCIGDIIIIRPGERVPLDGKVIEGSSMVDTSALTGESVPRQIKAGEGILSGFVNISGLLQVEVSKDFGESTVSRILDLVQNAGSKKAKTENFITKFAKYYTPIVVCTAAALAVIPPLVTGESFSSWFYRALIFLVISCPCALVLSIPLSFFGGIGGASRNGVLVKGGNFLEALNKIDTVVFDKTGTLTKGVFKVTSVAPESGYSKEQLLEYAALAEYYSNHPIAVSIIEAFNKEIDKERIKSHEEMPGYGVKVIADGKTILAGNRKIIDEAGIKNEIREIAGTIVHVAVDAQYAGYLLISDEIKEDSAAAIENLRKVGVRKLYMLTGDSRAIAAQVSKALKLDEVFGELLPHEKVEKMEEIYKLKGKGNLVFVGDGINDAPVLARADVGVAMGGLGSDAAIEAADVVLMTDEPSKLVTAVKIAKRTKKIVWQNIIFALGVKGIVLIMGAGGIATIWEAVFADVGVALIAILNAMRVMRTEKIR